MLAVMLLAALGLQEPNPADAVEALAKEYQEAQAALYKAVSEAKTDEERQRIWQEQNPASRFLPRFREAARRATGESAAEALTWIFRLAPEVQAQREGEALAREAAETLLKSHAASPRVAEVAGGLQYAHYSGWTWAKAWLREASTKAADRASKAAAMFSLAFMQSDASQATKDELEEARRLLKTLAKDFADTPGGKRADRQLFEIENLQVGCTAPDFEAKDVEGKSFKLSDYRGKVVLLDFWGFW